VPELVRAPSNALFDSVVSALSTPSLLFRQRSCKFHLQLVPRLHCFLTAAHHLWGMPSARSTQDFFATMAREPTRAERLARIDALATLLDTAFVIPGTQIRFGLDALIGLIPAIGDAITTAMSLYIVREARALGAPRLLVARMLANVMLDGVVGAVPLVGDAFDVAWRANRRNIALLLAHLDRSGEGRGFTWDRDIP
jgi:Domain of unknown function (DUF4112)